MEKQLNIQPKLIEKMKTIEYMELELNIQSKRISLVIVYRPESTTKHKYSMDEFYQEFEQMLSVYNEYKHEIIIMGDFNFHVNKPNDAKPKRFLETIELFKFINHVKEPTHRSGNTLDLILTRKDSILLDYKVDEMNSDHNNILFILNLQKPAPIKKNIRYRKL